MAGPRQFSLGYLFLEIFWIAAALGCATQAYRLPATPDAYFACKLLLIAASAVSAGAAFGGLGRDMFAGALVVIVAMGGAVVMVALTLVLAGLVR